MSFVPIPRHSIEEQRAINIGRRVENLTPEHAEALRVIRRRENLSPERAEAIRQSNRVENLTPERAEAIRRSYRVENLSAAQIQQRHESNRASSMNPERRERRNFFQSNAGRSQDAIVAERERNSTRVRFHNIQQEWDYDKECRHCRCIFLKSETAHQRKLCCQGGKFLEEDSEYPKLFPLPLYLKHLMVNYTEHLSSKSSYYNNMFSIASTGYDNGQDIGCERINGPAALKMNGRVYHYIPQCATERYGGIANFTYDGAYQLVEEHATSINGERPDPNVRIPFLKGVLLL